MTQQRPKKPPQYDGLTREAHVILADACTMMAGSPYNKHKKDPFAATGIMVKGNNASFVGCPIPVMQNRPIATHVHLLHQKGLVDSNGQGHFTINKKGYAVGNYVNYLSSLNHVPSESEIGNQLTIRFLGDQVPNMIISTLEEVYVEVREGFYRIIGKQATPGAGIGRYAPFAVRHNGDFRSLPSPDPYRQEPVRGAFTITRGGPSSTDEILRAEGPFIYIMTRPVTIILQSTKLVSLTQAEASEH